MSPDGNVEYIGDDISEAEFVKAKVRPVRLADNSLAGGTGAEDIQSSLSVLGSDNAVNSVGAAGSNVSIIGSSNAVNGDGSGFNTITGHSAVVEGTGNFAAGGNATSGASVTGNDNVVIGAGASSTVDNGVAIGSGSSAVMT